MKRGDVALANEESAINEQGFKVCLRRVCKGTNSSKKTQPRGPFKLSIHIYRLSL